MRAVVRNLAPLGCPVFLFWHAVGALVCLYGFTHALSSTEPSSGGFAAALIIPVWSGFVGTSMLKDLLRCPFTFCVPDYRRAFRRTLLVLGAITAATAATTALVYPDLDPWERAGAFGSATCFGMIVYLATAYTVLRSRNTNSLLGPLMIVAVGLLEVSAVRVLVQDVALFLPVVNVAILAACGIALWRWIDTTDLARKVCGESFLGLHAVWSTSATEEFAARGRVASLEKRPWVLQRWLTTRALARMRRPGSSPLRRFLIASLHENVGSRLPSSPFAVVTGTLFILALLLLVGYAPPKEGQDQPVANAVYFAACIVGSMVRLPVLSPLLLAVGRRERYLAALFMWAFSGLLVTVVSGVLFLVLWGLGEVAPTLTVGGYDCDLRPPDPRLILFPLALLPLAQVIQLVFRDRSLLPLVMLYIVAAVILMNQADALTRMRPLAVSLLLTGLWAFVAIVVRHGTLRGDLTLR